MGTSFLSDFVIPDPVVEVFGSLMMKHISPSYTDEDLKREFDIVWFLVTEALSQVPDLGGQIVSRDIYEERVQRLGEGKFCVLLRDALINKDWHSFLQNGILLNSITPTQVTQPAPTSSSIILSRHIFDSP
jgi:hypothetical protein